MQQQRSVYVYQHWPPCQICGAAVSKLQSGLATAETHITTLKLFPLPSTDLQDEAERSRESYAEEDVNDLPEQERKCTQGLVCHNHFPILINVFLV